MSALCAGRVRVLIVEEDNEVYQRIRRSLHSRGYRAEGAADGDQALARLQQRDFAVVVTDLRLTRVHGRDLLREVRRMDGFLPAVIYTGVPDPSPEGPLRQKGVFCVLMKGGASTHLLRSVEEACRTACQARWTRCA